MVDFKIRSSILTVQDDFLVEAKTGLSDAQAMQLCNSPNVTAKAFSLLENYWFPNEFLGDHRRKYFFGLHSDSPVVDYIGLNVGLESLLEKLKNGFTSLAQIKRQMGIDISTGIDGLTLRGELLDLFSDKLFRVIDPLFGFIKTDIYRSNHAILENLVPIIQIPIIIADSEIAVSIAYQPSNNLLRINDLFGVDSQVFQEGKINTIVSHYSTHTTSVDPVEAEQKFAYIVSKVPNPFNNHGVAVCDRDEFTIPVYLERYGTGFRMPANIYGYLGIIRTLYNEGHSVFTPQDIVDRVNKYQNKRIGTFGVVSQKDEINGSVELTEVETWMTVLSNASILEAKDSGKYSIPEMYLP